MTAHHPRLQPVGHWPGDGPTALPVPLTFWSSTEPCGTLPSTGGSCSTPGSGRAADAMDSKRRLSPTASCPLAAGSGGRLGLRLAPQGKGALETYRRRGRCPQIMGELGRQEKGEEEKREEEEEEKLRKMQG